MRMVRFGVLPLRVPEIRSLTINRVLCRAVFADAFFAIHVGDGPAVVAERGAVCTKQIQFGNGGIRATVPVR